MLPPSSNGSACLAVAMAGGGASLQAGWCRHRGLDAFKTLYSPDPKLGKAARARALSRAHHARSHQPPRGAIQVLQQ